MTYSASPDLIWIYVGCDFYRLDGSFAINSCHQARNCPLTSSNFIISMKSDLMRLDSQL